MKKWWIGGVAVLLVAACATSPTGRKQLILFGDGEVAQLGLTSFEELKKQEKISSDKKLTRYVQCVADAVVLVDTTGEPPAGVAGERLTIRVRDAQVYPTGL